MPAIVAVSARTANIKPTSWAAVVAPAICPPFWVRYVETVLSHELVVRVPNLCAVSVGCVQALVRTETPRLKRRHGDGRRRRRPVWGLSTRRRRRELTQLVGGERGEILALQAFTAIRAADDEAERGIPLNVYGAATEWYRRIARGALHGCNRAFATHGWRGAPVFPRCSVSCPPGDSAVCAALFGVYR